MSNSKIFQFNTFSSFVAPSFWHKLAEIKIDVDRLSDARKPINGFYTNSDVTHCLLETDATSFNRFVCIQYIFIFMHHLFAFQNSCKIHCILVISKYVHVYFNVLELLSIKIKSKISNHVINWL